jgi:hypothetical protein
MIVMVVVIVIGCTFALAICNALCSSGPRGHLTQEELDDARVRREETREGKIQAQINKLEKRLRGSRMRKAAVEGGLESARLLEEKKDEWDVKGKAVYGDAWDTEMDGNAPMKDLFSLPEEELRAIKIEAYNTAATKRRDVEETERTARETARNQTSMEINQARNKAMGIMTDPALAMVGGARRKHAPAPDAPFHDPRFVSRPSASRAQQQGEFSQAPHQFSSNPLAPPPPAPPAATTAPTTTSEYSAQPAQPALLDFRSRPAQAAAAPPSPASPATVFQAPGLSKPLPPPPASFVQQPNLAKPKPPPLPSAPPPKKKKPPSKPADDSLGGIFDAMNSGGIRD